MATPACLRRLAAHIGGGFREKLKVPTTAQDQVRTGPLAALLILLSLFLAAGSGAAGDDLRAPAARLGAGRHVSSTALLPAGARNPSDDEMSGTGADPSLLPPPPGIVTERLSARPAAEPAAAEPGSIRRAPSASYRARAPPAA
jgi:hypothetical protein